MSLKINYKRAFALLLVLALFSLALSSSSPVAALEDKGTIVIDLSHGQEDDHGGSWYELDVWMQRLLERMGYTVVWARGGLNSSILANADGLIIGSIFGDVNAFLTAEYDAIEAWFATGHKFLWVAYDSDYTRVPTEGKFIGDNSTEILERVGSHVYGEPTALYDIEQNVAGQSYRVISNETSTDPFVADMVAGVTRVMTHSPTVLYGSDSATPGENVSAVDLETNSITNVHTLWMSSNASQIQDGDTPLAEPFAHEDGQQGSFVVCTIEVDAGTTGDSVIVVSGSKPYGGYHPMFEDYYDPEHMDGYKLVLQTIDWGIDYATYVPPTTTTTTTTTPTTTEPPPPPPDNTLFLAAMGIEAVIIVLLLVAFVRKS